ncbi:hypothetical protein SAMN05421770_1029 [Granulicella rosea]|uniref:Uncharacterized protein n=1 Tax=Granulicella rosea TaxID=474952 RepID=A0A239GNT2_9BACT|nr:hypothetical protein SAMN05421770_1029 [Granulicella rosea]
MKTWKGMVKLESWVTLLHGEPASMLLNLVARSWNAAAL